MIELFQLWGAKESTSESHPEHHKYSTAKPAHEAGFDSYLTAKVLIRLAAKLEAVMPGAPTGDKSLRVTSESGLGEDFAANHHGHSDSSSEGVPLPAEMLDAPSKKGKVSAPNPRRKPRGLPPPTAFSHSTMFGVLANEVSSDEDLIDLGFEAPGFKKSPKRKGAKRGTSDRQSPPPPKMMPPFQSEFWSVYGNKLRVNGTVEGVCHMKAVV